MKFQVGGAESAGRRHGLGKLACGRKVTWDQPVMCAPHLNRASVCLSICLSVSRACVPGHAPACPCARPRPLHRRRRV